MSVQALVAWLRTVSPTGADAGQLLSMVKAARAERPSDALLARLLADIQHQLQDGDRPLELLERLLESRIDQPVELPGSLLDQALRESAASLPSERWYTDTMQALGDCLAAAEDGDGEAFEAGLEWLKAHFQAAWDRYASVPVALTEVTSETAVRHRLIVEALQGWLDALGAAEEDFPWEDVLFMAEQANRLLVAVAET